MAQRQTVIKVPTPEIQGEGSYVEIQQMTVAEAQAYQERINSGIDDATLVTEVLIKYVVGWDWVDENGDPLPLPSEKGDVMHLLSHELLFLSNQVGGRSIRVKN